MKSISNAKWEVRIQEIDIYGFFWVANNISKESGIWDLTMVDYCGSERKGKNNWLKFAKVNGIKNWKFAPK
jgi:hypothetical protein